MPEQQLLSWHSHCAPGAGARTVRTMTEPQATHDHAHHDHPHSSHGDSGHDHSGHDHSGHGGEADFDWAAAAESIALDASVMQPVVEAALAQVDLTGATRLLDLGSGPGVMANLLAGLAPGAEVVAADGSPQLLEQALATAVANGAADRVSTRQVDLDAVRGAELTRLLLDGGTPFDLVWASMVLHHVHDWSGVLRAVHDAVRPGGRIVLVEMGGALEIFPDGSSDPLVTSGAWSRVSARAAEALRAHLPEGAMDVRWDDELRTAGFVDVRTEVVVVSHPAPLEATQQRWLAWFLGNLVAHAASRMSEPDRAALAVLTDALGAPATSSATSATGPSEVMIRTSRTVVTGVRPPG